MSFGFGVGDFLAVLQLANKIPKDFADAPKQAKDLSDNVQNMTMLFRNILSDDKSLTAADKGRLDEILKSSKDILHEMEVLVNSELFPCVVTK